MTDSLIRPARIVRVLPPAQQQRLEEALLTLVIERQRRQEPLPTPAQAIASLPPLDFPVSGGTVAAILRDLGAP